MKKTDKKNDVGCLLTVIFFTIALLGMLLVLFLKVKYFRNGIW